MPHGTERKGSLSELKPKKEVAKDLRDIVYIPQMIKDSSLRSEHPLTYNGIEKILDKLGKYIFPLGEIKIDSYIGKV